MNYLFTKRQNIKLEPALPTTFSNGLFCRVVKSWDCVEKSQIQVQPITKFRLRRECSVAAVGCLIEDLDSSLTKNCQLVSLSYKVPWKV